MPQFINGKDTIMIDGKGYGVGLVQIKRKADVLDKYAKRTVSGDLRREILGVYFNYELTFGSFYDMDQYSRLFNKLTEAREFHMITIPTNKGMDTYKGYISKVQDVIEYVNGSDRRVTGLTCHFVAKEPHSTPLDSWLFLSSRYNESTTPH